MPALSIGLVQIEGPSASTRPGPGWIDRACHLGPDSRLLKQPPTDRTSRSCQSGCGVARTDSQSGASDQCHSQCFWPDRTNRPERAQSTGSERTTRTAAFAKTPTASEPIGPFLHAALGRAGPDRTDPGRQDRAAHRIDRMRPDLDSPSTSTSSRPARTPEPAHFSDRGRLFQADRGRRFSAIVDALGLRASEVFNVSQSSTISLKRGVDGPLSMRPQGAY